MHEKLGHEISEKTIQLAQQHLAEPEKHPKQVEEQEQAIEGQSESDIQAKKSIKKHSQDMQQHLVAAKELANKLEQTKSTEVYIQMNSEHTLAVQEHIEATKEFSQISKSNETLETSD